MKYTQIKKCCLILVIIISSSLLQGCYRNDIRSEDIKVPQLSGEPCAKVILRKLSKQKGIKEVTFDYANRLVSVSFDSKLLSIKNLEHTISGLGFDVKARYKNKAEAYLIPGDEKARKRLSPSCR